MMSKVTIAAVAIVALLGAGIVVAQTGGLGTTTPAATTNAGKPDAKYDEKFASADKDKNGTLEGAELDTWKADLAKIDSDKDGKVSKAEFAAAGKAGVIK